MSGFEAVPHLTSSADSSGSESSRILKEVVRICPICHLDLAGHDYRWAAATPLGHEDEDMDRFRALMAAIKRHDWPKVLTFQHWLSELPNAELYCIKCTAHQKLSVALILAPFAWEDPYILMHIEPVADGEMLAAGLPESDTWHRF